MTDWNPTWKDRQTYGRNIPVAEVVKCVGDAPADIGGGLEWRQIGFLATMYTENNGFVEWARPMVYKPGYKDHNSVDRGICALNSFWWSWVPDITAYDWKKSLWTVLTWLQEESKKGTKGSKPWDWRPLLDWQWHGYEAEGFAENVIMIRSAVNVERAGRGLPPV